MGGYGPFSPQILHGTVALLTQIFGAIKESSIIKPSVQKVMISDSLNVSHQQLPTRHLLPPQELFADSFSYSLTCPKGKELLKN